MITRRKLVALYAVTVCRTQGVFALVAQPWAGKAEADAPGELTRQPPS